MEVCTSAGGVGHTVKSRRVPQAEHKYDLRSAGWDSSCGCHRPSALLGTSRRDVQVYKC